jgi:hypothetical protein
VATIERMWPHAACRINSNYDPGKSMTYYWVEFGKIKAIYMQPPGESDVVKPYGLNELRARLTREYWILGNAVCWYVDGEFCFKDKTIAVNMQTAEPVNQKGCGVNAIPAKDTASFSKFLDGLKDHGNQEPEYDRVVATIKRSHPNAYCRYAGVRMDEADLDFIGHRYYWIDKGDIVAVYLTTNKHE